ncbi:hypothetical protein ACIS_00010 [Anaplasma centrale str. Israel]|uniref:Uncharacterized protein n=1 Tax=Anaplasma centrale (strain Israel) TaxID=574556 RepID=D1AT58_ANACI|nr:hypothetical protein [Anaplasma centrale]ACZ48736.1 hypothetical protein ACIS_00010 [Anaplasma centrale str. Israel]
MFDLGNTYDLALRVDDADLSHNFTVSDGHVVVTNGEVFASHNPLQYCNTPTQEPMSYCKSHVMLGKEGEVTADIYNSALTGVTLNTTADKKSLEVHFSINPLQALPMMSQMYPGVQVQVYSQAVPSPSDDTDL